MSTFVTVNTYTHSVTYVTHKMLKSLKDIIALSGLSPERMVTGWVSLNLAIRTWLTTHDLQRVILEVYNPVVYPLVVDGIRRNYCHQQFLDGPDVIGQFRGHCRRLPLPALLADLYGQGEGIH